MILSKPRVVLPAEVFVHTGVGGQPRVDTRPRSITNEAVKSNQSETILSTCPEGVCWLIMVVAGGGGHHLAKETEES